MHDRILFIKVAWLDRFQGDDALPTNGPEESQYGERFNFKTFQGRVYGIDPARHHGFTVKKADAHPWLVISIATPPEAGAVKVYWPAGWYEQARLVTTRVLPERPEYAGDPNFPTFQNGHRFRYAIHTGAGDAYLIPEARRHSPFPEIPMNPHFLRLRIYARGPGQTAGEEWRERYALIAEEIITHRNLAERCDQVTRV
jgi:hypothetical protein